MDPEFIELYLDFSIERNLVAGGLPLVKTPDGLAIAIQIDSVNNLVKVFRPDLSFQIQNWRLDVINE